MRKLITLLSILAVSLSLLVSCGPSTTTPITSKPTIQKSITSADVSWFIRRENGIDPNYFTTADTNYVAVDEEWFKANIMDTFNAFLSKNGVAIADAKKNDCDNFARAFSFHTRVKSMQSKFMNADMAVGDLYYKNLDFGHAINVAIVLDKEGNKKLIFIEPQGPSIVKLDDEYKKYYIIYIGF